MSLLHRLGQAVRPAAMAMGLLFFLFIWVKPAAAQAAGPVGGEPVGSLYHHPTYGFSIWLPAHWELDESLAPVVTRAYGPNRQMEAELFFVPREPGFSEGGYLVYGNRSILEGRSGIQLLSRTTARVGGYTTYLWEWKRPATRLVPDRRLAWQADILGPTGILTLTVRATEEVYPEAAAAARAAIETVVWGAPVTQEAQPKTSAPSIVAPPPGDSQQPLPDQDPVEQDPLANLDPAQRRLAAIPWLLSDDFVWGMYHWSLNPEFPYWYVFHDWERRLDHRFQLVMTYQVLGQRFPTAFVKRLTDEGRTVMLTLQSWQPINQQDVYDKGTTLYYDVLNGVYDDVLRQYARDAAALERPFLFRLDNEMNSDWTPWGAWFYAKETDIYRAVWRYVHHIFQEEGADNALWVWNPHDRSLPPFPWNHFSLYYPGDEFVDVIGLTVYNVGDAYPGDTWRDFHEAMDAIYEDYSRRYGHKPFLMTEMASHEGGGDKGAWIRSLAAPWREYPNVRGAVWWNGIDDRRDYRIDSSPEAEAAFWSILRIRRGP